MTTRGIIYLWRNKLTGKKYVGRSIRPKIRKLEHIRLARKGSQNPFHCALREYGIEAFSYRILEENIHAKHLTKRENFYIESHNTLSPNGYNQNYGGVYSEETRNKLSVARSKIHYWVTDPNGVSTKIMNMYKFCRDHGLDVGSMAKVYNGYRDNHKGWRCVKVSGRLAKMTEKEQAKYIKSKHTKPMVHGNAETYWVTDPNGVSTKIMNMSKFCSENGLFSGAMGSVYNGKYDNHKGWRCDKVEGKLAKMTEKEQAKYIKSKHTKPMVHGNAKSYWVTDPNGVKIKVINLGKFCSENGLFSGAMAGVSNGRYKQHKGYRCKRIS